MKRFKRVYIEITNVCNMSCSFCSKLTRAKRFMSKSEFEKVLDQIKPYTDYVYFHIKGEPTLHPDFFEFLDLCEKCKLRVNLTTNATTLGKIYKQLEHKKALRQINISLHSFEKKNYPDKNEAKIAFDTYIDPIINAILYLQEKTDIIVVYRLWNQLSDRDVSEQNNWIIDKLSSAYNIDINNEFKNSSFYKRTEQSIKLREHIFISKENEFVWPSECENKQNNNIVNGFCYGLVTMAGILVDGTVVPCCLDADGDISLGNIFEQEFKDIINSKMSLEIYEGFKNRIVANNFCKNCTYRLRFNKTERE